MGKHRAERQGRHRPAAGRPPVTAHHRAATPVRTPFASLTGRFPAVPTIVGITALAAAGVGAVTIDHEPTAAPSAFVLSSHTQHLTGTDAVGFVGGPRERAISRDSERQALQAAADAELKAAAEQQAAERNAALKSLGKAAEARAGEIARNQWKLPTTGYRLTARFGMAGSMWSSNHTGLDMAAPAGTPIVAVANGVIKEAGSAGSYGNLTVQTLTDGTEIWYAHQLSIGVQVGQTVRAGQQIGTVGTTGNSTGNHLHIEVRPGGGDPVDPEQAFAVHGLTP